MIRWLLTTILLVMASLVCGDSIVLLPPEGIAYQEDLLVQLGVKDLEAAVRFYTETLGFVLTERRDDLKFAHIATNVKGLQIGLSEQPQPLGSCSVLLNIGVIDVESARRVLEGKGIAFKGPTRVIPGKVALAEFADPDGNRLRFAGPPPRSPQE